MTTNQVNGPSDADFRPSLRIGHGYDLHRLDLQAPSGQGRPFVLGGITIEHSKGPVGHSDADVLLHAITDGLLGAIGEPDIGQIFKDTDPAHDGQDSAVFLGEATKRVREQGYQIMNLDATVICEQPKIGPHIDRICQNIANLLGVQNTQVNVKSKTHERVDAVGEERAIEAHCVVLLSINSSS